MNHSELIDDPKFCTLQQRRKNAEELIEIIENWLKSFDDISEACKILDDTGIPSAKVFDQEDVMNDIHIRSQKYLTEVPVPSNVTSKDNFVARNCIAQFSETPGKIKKAPSVGENTKDILSNYGLTEEQMTEIQI